MYSQRTEATIAMAEVTYATDESFFDTEFISTKFGLVRICQFVIALLSLIVVEIPSCRFSRSLNIYVFIASSSLIFAIIVLIIFLTRFYKQIERYINLPLTLLVNESLAIIFWLIASILIIFTNCEGSGPKVAYIIAGILGFLATVAFAYSAQISYNWFRNGSIVATS
ncbi:CKLF-like MARVEL transmembrane domain-containing protein 4 [Blomia tropicalis]|nr:CKLF-like MARVEL transmembrane domain-containing protein 4 [Blomia tropicalis]